MSGDLRRFRRRLIGGFNQTDVIRYIEELSAQRNKYRSTGDRLETELTILNDEIKRLRSELDDADRRILEIKIKTLDETSGSITSLSETYSAMRADVETAALTVSGALVKLGSTLTSLTFVLDKTNHRFTELRSMLEEEKAGAAAAVRGGGRTKA